MSGIQVYPTLPVTAPVAAHIGPLLAQHLERARDAGVVVDDETVGAIEELDAMGRAWRAGWRGAGVPIGSAEVPIVDLSGSEPVEWISVTTAAHELDISARAVRKRLHARSLRGEMVRGAWRIDRSSLDPKEGT